MKIGIVSTAIYRNPPLKYGGTELIAYYQAKVLSKNHDVYLFTVNETDNINNVNVIRCGSEGKVTELEMYNKYKDKLNDLDIVLDNSFEAYPFLFKKENPNSKVKIFHFFHSGIPFNSNPPIPKNEIHYVAVSKWYASLLIDLYDINVDYLYNAIDDSLYNTNNIKKDNYFLFISVLLPDKGILKAIRLFKEFYKIHKDYKLFIVGLKVEQEGYESYNKLLSKEIISNSDFIEYKGEVSLNEKISLFQHAKALLLPLSYARPEYYGLVYAEALASGTPVITIPHGSSYELSKFEDNNSFLLPITDNEFIDSFNKVIQYNENDYKNCMAYAHKYMSLDKYQQDLENLINKY
jgi:glycosyltransferase involved in cell wall biosynthesis